jgi:toxin ParE1/3/4
MRLKLILKLYFHNQLLCVMHMQNTLVVEGNCMSASEVMRDSLRLLEMVRARCNKIACALRSGTSRPELWQGLRWVPFSSYMIFYTVDASDAVRIERVLHGSRDIEAMFNDDGHSPAS